MKRPLLSVDLRRLTPTDAEAGVALAQRVGWSHSAVQWEQFIRWSGEGAFGIFAGAHLVATTIVTVHGAALAWVGAVITDPDYQGQGLARQLMERALAYTHEQNIANTLLDATDKGYPLYERLGFRPLYRNLIFAGLANGTPPATPYPCLTADNLDGVIAQDAAMMGCSRAPIIRDLWQADAAWGDDEGYLFVQQNTTGVSLGPWYHRTAEGAERLLRTALTSLPPETRARVIIPEANVEAQRVAQTSALSLIGSGWRMALGDNPPGLMTSAYGIASFAVG